MARLKSWQLPLRAATGVFILDQGLSKRGAEGEQASQLHGTAAGAFPQVSDLEAEQFVRMLSAAEISLGTVLLVPVVPPALAGAALTAFAAGLMRVYLKTPGMREEGSLRPTMQGMMMAKDSWILAIGTALLLDALADRRRR
ncbi:MAG: hypothetical protein M3N17_09050 [Actinomycetota bacterium]|nr:hypothetical protein [Actinomycetota bacterium]